MFEKSQVEFARGRVLLSALVRQRVKLKPVSGGFTGLCPLHRERTPSFFVYTATNKFKCYGCGAYGDAIDWAMLIKGVSFIEAVEELSEGWTEPSGIKVWDAKPVRETTSTKTTFGASVTPMHFG